ncbi:MAG TPA: hypothetical protein PKK10_07795 [Woeseiaceae bacterium]|nr:hypothetical protein [Woeseiaceae bacterium]
MDAGTRLAIGDDKPPPAGTAQTVAGNYCRITTSSNDVFCEIDRLGLYKVYHTADRAIVCSSFLALAEILPQLTVLEQGVYEYLIQGATYGRDTPLAEIRVADPCERIEVVSGRIERIEQRSPAIGPAGGDHGAMEQLLHMLRARFRAIADLSDGKIDTALSGGYDSRLMLALLMETGIRPRLHVYGSADSPDVKIAKSIAGQMSLELTHIDKSAMTRNVGDPLDMVPANYLAMDGLCSDGIFNNGADLATRRARAASGALALNGGGGEIYRNFFYLPDRPYTVEDVVKVFYHRFAADTFSRRFEQKAYAARLGDKLAESFSDQRHELSRSDVEWLYPYFRCRFWMGRNNSINNRFGPALTPLLDYDLAQIAMAVSIRAKNHGRFEAGLIRRISPELASFASEYGYSFAAEPPLRQRWSDTVTMHRPIWIRQHAYRIKRALRRAAPDGASISLAAVHKRYPHAVDRMREYLAFNRLSDPAQIQRAASLGYLFAELGC